MSLSRAYHLEEEGIIPSYNTECCLTAEYGRVRSVAFIHRSYLPAVLTQPDDYGVWDSGKRQGLIIIISQTSGTFDPGDPEKLKGYGRRISTHGMRIMTLTFFDPAYMENAELYSFLERSTKYAVAFRTGSVLHITDSASDTVAKNPVEEDLDAQITWNVTCSLRSWKLPQMVAVSSILSLFICTPPARTNYLITEDGIVILSEDGAILIDG